MSHGAVVREWLPLAGLMVSAFVFNASEFMPVGLLLDIGESFGASESQTGMLVSIYAWAVMLLSLPLMVVATRVPFRPLLLGVVALFAAGQLLSSVAASYEALMGARLVVAASHAVFWAIVAPIAVRIASPSRQSLALSMVVMGSSVAMIVGLPLGRSIGLFMGWRLAFGCVCAVATALLVYLAVLLPRVSGAEPFSLSRLPGVMKNKALFGLFALTALYSLGYYTVYSYIEPFLQQVGGLDDAMITVALSSFGVAGVVGSVLYARVGAAHSRAFLCLVVGGVAASLFLIAGAAFGAVAAFSVCALWGLSGAAFSAASQGEIIRSAAGDEETVAMAIFSGIFNFGIGTGALLGGARWSTLLVCASSALRRSSTAFLWSLRGWCAANRPPQGCSPRTTRWRGPLRPARRRTTPVGAGPPLPCRLRRFVPLRSSRRREGVPPLAS